MSQGINVGKFRKALGMPEDQSVGAITVQTGRVKAIDGEASFWSIDGDQNLQIGVELDDGREMWCEDGPVLGTGAGAWGLLSEGDEVIVGFPVGDELNGYILRAFATGRAPSQDLAEGRLLLTGSKIYAYSGDGASKGPLALLSELQDAVTFLKAQFDTSAGHVHSGGVLMGALTGPPTTPGTGTGTGYVIQDPNGTQVLEAE